MKGIRAHARVHAKSRNDRALRVIGLVVGSVDTRGVLIKGPVEEIMDEFEQAEESGYDEGFYDGMLEMNDNIATLLERAGQPELANKVKEMRKWADH